MALFGGFKMRPFGDGEPEWFKKITSVFGYMDYQAQTEDKGIAISDTRKTLMPAYGENGDIVGAQFYGNMRRYINYDEPTKLQKLAIYRQMADYAEIKYALSMICDELLNYDDLDGNVAKLIIENDELLKNVNKRDNLKKEWRYVFDELMNFKDNGRDAILSFLISGELIYEKIINPQNKKDGLKRVKRLRPDNVYPVWKDDLDGIEYFNVKSAHYGGGGVTGTIPKSQLAYVSWDYYTHNPETGDIYTLSYLEPVKKVWRQLQLLEEAMVIYKIVRAPERRVFKIATGNMPRAQAEAYVQKVMRQFRQKKIYNTSSGEIDGQSNIMSMLEDYWFAQPADGNTTEVDTLQGGCLTLDTKIPLLDGRILEMKDVIAEHKSGKKNWVYSCNPETGAIVPGPITHAEITNTNAEVMKITLDNGKSVTCTLNHKWPTWNKGTVEANKLEVGDSFLPFNRDQKKISNMDNKYERVFDNFKKEWVFTHRMVANYMKENDEMETKVYKHAEVFNTVHHQDFNRFNNNPENLVWMDRHDHFKMHSEYYGQYASLGGETHSLLLKTDENYRNNWLKNCKEGKENMTDEDYEKMIKKQSESAKKQIASLSPEERKIRAENGKKSLKKGQKIFRNKMSTDIEYREKVLNKLSDSLTKTKNTPEFKQKQSNMNKERWKDVNYYSKVIGPQTVRYNNEMMKILVDEFKNGHEEAEEMVSVLSSNEQFMNTFNDLNKNVKRLLGFQHQHLIKMLKTFNYAGWRDFKNKHLMFNHKIVKIEYLAERQVVANLTVDAEEKYHNYHCYALDIGVFTLNSNLQSMEDVQYFLEKLYRALEIPANRRVDTPFGDQKFNSGSIGDVTWQEVKFSKMVNRIRRKMTTIIFDIYKSHLKLKGLWDQYNLKDSDFRVEFNKNNYFEELKRAQIEETRLNNFGTVSSYVGDVFSKEKAVKHFLHWSDEDWLENKRLLEQEKLEGDADMEGGGGGPSL
jgi:polyhydroxyalkanoate synthesis regulator phasin